MENPLTQCELAYLAGIIDGEGTITLERTGNRRMNGVMGLSPKVIITNTNEDLIQHCLNLFIRAGINPHVKSQDKNYGLRKKPCYWITVQGLSKCKKILSVLRQHLTAKYSQALLILEFIEIRGESESAKGKPYGYRELGILDKIRALNHRGVSETEDCGLRRRVFNTIMRESNDSPSLQETVWAK